LLVLRGKQGLAVVAMAHSRGCKATYEWRFKRSDGPDESRGSGAVFEQFATAEGNKGEKVGVNVGGRRRILAGPYTIEWSCGGPTFGWIYPATTDVEAYAMARTALESFRF